MLNKASIIIIIIIIIIITVNIINISIIKSQLKTTKTNN